MSKRLFVALEPSADCRTLVTDARDSLAEAFPDLGVRWQPSGNLHLTLFFLGNVADDMVEDCEARLAACARRAERFELSTARLGAFPSAFRPSVIWLGIGAEPLAALASLQRDLASSYRHVRDERRPFRPHITLGRVKTMSGVDRAAFAATLAEHPRTSVAWRVGEVVLFESTLAADGAVHTARQTAGIPE